MWVVFSLFLLVGIAVLDDYGMSWDEWTQKRLTEANLSYILGIHDDLRLKQQDKYDGVAVELPLLWVERTLGLEDTRSIYLSRHLLTHLFFLLAGVFCYLLALRLFNHRLLALFAMLLFLLHPRLYAHSFFNTKDLPFLSMFMITLFLIHRAFDKNTVRAFLWCGAGVAVLINLRVMGVMLWIAVVAMRGLDVWYATSPEERKHILKTGGAFILSSVLITYAVWPYLWEDPLGRLAEALTTASHYPGNSLELFKGTFVNSTDLPWDYVPTWFLITTPWVALLLGGIGIVAAGVRGVIQPRKILRNTPLRFVGLLLACFVLPILAVIVLNATLYSGWRHMYFIYVPFCLLAAYGLYWLVSFCKQKPLRVGAYALAGIGLVGAAIEMAQIHPHQNVYFNGLVDRRTPEYLATQYNMDYWGVSYREGLEYLLERYPDSPIRIYKKKYTSADVNRMILPATERRRIVFDHAPSNAFHFVMYPMPTKKEKLIHATKIYNSTSLAVVAVNLDLLLDERAFYRDVYHKAKAEVPVTRSVFDVYWYRGGGGLPHHDSAVEFRYEDKLVYIRESCHPDDLRERFFVHILPVNKADLPDWRKPHDFDNRDFDFPQHGVRFDGKCIAAVPLPKYEINSIRTGQYISYLPNQAPSWQATFSIRKEP